MGINLRDFVKNVNDLFTFEEAEQLFIAAGYKEKGTLVDGFENIEITHEILHSNQQSVEKQSNIKFHQNFDIQVKQKNSDHSKKSSIEIQGFELISRHTSADMGGAA